MAEENLLIWTAHSLFMEGGCLQLLPKYISLLALKQLIQEIYFLLGRSVFYKGRLYNKIVTNLLFELGNKKLQYLVIKRVQLLQTNTAALFFPLL